MDEGLDGEPVLRVVRGRPDIQELAALTLVLRAAPRQPAPTDRPRDWSAYWHSVGTRQNRRPPR